MLKLATMINNPGEPIPDTRYRDPHELARLGYNGLIIFETAGLSGIGNTEDVGSGEMRRWVEHHFDQVSDTITHANEAGLQSFICYDTLVLAREVAERARQSMSCKNQPRIVCPGSDAAVALSLKGLEHMLRRLPEVAGVVLRFGDNDADRMPFLIGNDIYAPHCPRCSSMSRADRVIMIVKKFYDLVCGKFGKTLIARAWNVRPRGMHDSVELCKTIASALPTSGNLIFSFKFTETDFWRYQRWNPASLELGDRPVIYELQCQREFEGKGGVPNWQVPLWRDGSPETAEEAGVAGLAAVSKKINLAGYAAPRATGLRPARSPRLHRPRHGPPRQMWLLCRNLPTIQTRTRHRWPTCGLMSG